MGLSQYGTLLVQEFKTVELAFICLFGDTEQDGDSVDLFVVLLFDWVLFEVRKATFP